MKLNQFECDKCHRRFENTEMTEVSIYKPEILHSWILTKKDGYNDNVHTLDFCRGCLDWLCKSLNLELKKNIRK